MIYKRYILNQRAQEVGESLNHYITDVMKQVELCQYGNLKDELVRDRLLCGIKDDRIREKLLNKKDLTVQKAIEILRTSQATQFQVRDMATEQEMGVKVVKTNNKTVSRDGPAEGQWTRTTPSRRTKPCRYCGNRHEFKKKHSQHMTRNAGDVVGKAIFQKCADQLQKCRVWRMIAAMRRKCFS